MKKYLLLLLLLLLPLLLIGCDSVVPVTYINKPEQLITNTPVRFVVTSSTIYMLGSESISIYEIKDIKGSNDFVVVRSGNGAAMQPVSRVSVQLEDKK